MRHSDYIPLASADGVEPRQLSGSTKRSGRRRFILGTSLVVVLVAGIYLLSGDPSDVDDLFEDDVEYLPEFQAAYLPFEPPPQNRSVDMARLTPTQVLPDHCRDAYFATGALCYDPDLPSMDVIWTWVNGSDSLLREAKLKAESRFSADDPYRPKTSSNQVRHYR